MITGSGLLARAFAAKFRNSNRVHIYSAGVSNSACRNPLEFEREKNRLTQALKVARGVDCFVYFGTCSVSDPLAADTPYVQHKLRMEALASEHPRYLTLRLPQVAGKTPNPHTLLNYLYVRISRSESFTLWANSGRNIIDVEDVVAVARQLIADTEIRRKTINVANTKTYSVPEIVNVMEKVVGKRAVCSFAPLGSYYPIDTAMIEQHLPAADVHFDNCYLERVLVKYYGQ